MKLLLGLTIFFISACASTQKASEFQAVIRDIKSGNTKAAEKVNPQEKYEVFVDGTTATMSGKQARKYADTLAEYVTYCQDLTNSANKLKDIEVSTEDGYHELKKQILEIDHNFKKNCGINYYLQDLQKHSKVDLWGLRELYSKVITPIVEQSKAKLADYEELRKTQSAEALAQKQVYKNTPEYLAEKMCDLSGLIKQAKRRIDQEYKIGKTSGVVDKKVLHDNGSRVQTWTGQLNTLKKSYKAKSGKLWSQSQCK